MELSIRVTKIGTQSVEFLIDLGVPSEDRPRATARLTTAVIGMGEFRPVDLPLRYREALSVFVQSDEP